MATDPEKFKKLVQESLRRQVKAIDELAAAGKFYHIAGNLHSKGNLF